MDKEFLDLIDSVEELIPHDEKLDDDVLICECFCVNVGDIRETGLTKIDLAFLNEKFHMGQGCQSCIKNKDSWIDKVF
jgi:NAD(P)H-nitrite reductase large subunit